jgi:hypothetical protein
MSRPKTKEDGGLKDLMMKCKELSIAPVINRVTTGKI